MRMVAVGPHFYGVFPAVNTPTPANFFPNGGGTVRFQRNNNGTSLLGTDNTTVIASSTDPFFFKVEERDVTFILNRDPIGQDEVDARRMQPPWFDRWPADSRTHSAWSSTGLPRPNSGSPDRARRFIAVTVSGIAGMTII